MSYYNIIAVRAEPSDKSEMVTQLLFGDRYYHLNNSENGKWSKIKIDYDDYEGWIDAKLVHALDEHEWHTLGLVESEYCLQPSASLISKQGGFSPIPFGADLSCLKVDKRKRQFSNIAEVAPVDEIPFLAKSFLGTPYLWGGKTHFGVDCSGLTQQVLKVAGVKIPRDAYQQAECGELVEFKDREYGDLVFFRNEEGRIHHVGIVVEKNKIVHAHGEVRQDKIDESGIFDKEKEVYTHKFDSIRRMY